MARKRRTTSVVVIMYASEMIDARLKCPKLCSTLPIKQAMLPSTALFLARRLEFWLNDVVVLKNYDSSKI